MTALLSGGIGSPPMATLVFSLGTAIVFLFSMDREPSMRKTGIAILPVALLAVFVSLGGGALGLVTALLAAGVANALAVQEDPRAAIPAFVVRLASRGILAAVFAIAIVTSADYPGALRIGVCVLAVIAVAASWWIGRPNSKRASIRLAFAAALAATAALSAPPTMMLGAFLVVLCDVLDLRRSTGPQAETQPRSPSDMPAVRGLWLLCYIGHALVALSAVTLPVVP